MSKGIPSVKTWVVTTTKGARVEVLAPTRYLALLNYRFAGNCGPEIRTIGLKRSVKRR